MKLGHRSVIPRIVFCMMPLVFTIRFYKLSMFERKQNDYIPHTLLYTTEVHMSRRVYQRHWPVGEEQKIGDSINDIVRLLNDPNEEEPQTAVEEIYEMSRDSIVEIMSLPSIVQGRWTTKIVTYFDLSDDLLLYKSDVRLWSEHDISNGGFVWFLKFPSGYHYIQPWVLYDTIQGEKAVALFLYEHFRVPYDVAMKRLASGDLREIARYTCCLRRISTSVTLEIARWYGPTGALRCRCVIRWHGTDVDELCSVNYIPNFVAAPGFSNHIAMMADAKFDLYQEMESDVFSRLVGPCDRKIHVAIHTSLYDEYLRRFFK